MHPGTNIADAEKGSRPANTSRRPLVLMACLLCAITIYATHYILNDLWRGRTIDLASDLARASSDWLPWLILVPLIDAYLALETHRVPHRARTYVRIAFLAAICASHLASSTLLLQFIATGGAAGPSLTSELARPVHRALARSAEVAIVSSTILAILLARRTHMERARIAARSYNYRRIHHEAQLQGLRMQLSSHFVLNSLNTILGELHDNPCLAAELMDSLGTLLETSATADQDLHPLRRELALVRAFLSIEEARFGDRLKVRWSIEDDVHDEPVPTFAVQTLVENAVAHGLARTLGDFEIEVEVRRMGPELDIRVIDAGGRINDEGSGNGIALANLRQRIELIYGHKDRVRLEVRAARTVAQVLVPAMEAA